MFPFSFSNCSQHWCLTRVFGRLVVIAVFKRPLKGHWGTRGVLTHIAIRLGSDSCQPKGTNPQGLVEQKE